MSNLERIENMKQVVRMIEPDFNQLAKIHNAVNFEREASFAIQALQSNSYLAGIAMSNQDSLRRAVVNVAAVGLTLSPVHKLAYLVPRDKMVCLDISYRGYIQLGVECGAILWALAEIVCETDNFKYLGMGKEPLHEFNPFDKSRGEIVGAYCVAKTPGGEYITTMMPIEDVYSIRSRSSAWKAYTKDKSKINPWVTDPTEMIKKTVIRRAYKAWPMSENRERLDQAIDVSFESDPIDVGPITVADQDDQSGLDKIRQLLKKLNKDEFGYINHAVRVFKRQIKNLEDLTEMEVKQSIVMLESFLKTAKPKIKGEV